MFKIEAPFPAPQTTVILPSPSWGNSQALTLTVNTIHTISGKLFTYVKQRDARRKFIWEFVIARSKALELRAFFNVYFSKQIKITDHSDNIYIGYFTSNPFEFAGASRAINFPGNEIMNISIEFEEA